MNKFQSVLIIFLLLGVSAGWFYWFKYRPSEIRKECFKEVYSKNKNLEWVEGKEWMSIDYGRYGWVYPYWRMYIKEDVYKGCLIFKGIK